LISNLAFKVTTVIVLGGRRLWRNVALPYVLTIAVGIGIALWWH